MKEEKKKDLAYYLTLFKIEGHTTWRAHLGQFPDSFDRQKQNDNWPAVTEKQVLRIDRITGGFKNL